ncbi:MAG: flagellar biosynthesis switch protein [Bdellovibrionales bacterium RBG_16_40_8]|nr:MAG: flagellar biosynthesis switch protein [Bdellovibrionales bacterium RBG_16_40_8]
MVIPRRKRTRTISVTSGKGGVGKSTLISNMALKLSQEGHRVLILDGDLGMANIDVMFGVRCHYTVEHVLAEEKTLKEILVEIYPNVFLIPGGSGVYGLQRIDTYHKKLLLDEVSELEGGFDYMLIDTASGIDDNVLYLNSAAQETLVVVTPEPASLTDAYALIKILNIRLGENRFSVVVNMALDEREAMNIYRRLSDVAQKFLCISLDYKGFVPLDANLRAATKSQQLVLQMSPGSPSSYAIRALTEKFSGYTSIATSKGGMQFFWEQLVGATL